MRKVLVLFILLLACAETARAQPRAKRLTRAQLVGYLSKTADVQEIAALVRHPSGYYPGTSDRIVNTAGWEQPANPCSIEAQYRNDIRSGHTWARYQRLLQLIRDTKPKMLLDAVSMWGTWEMTEHLNRCRYLVRDVKAIDPDIVVMATPNEYVNRGIFTGRIIPQYVWDAFGLPNENRPFDCRRMKPGITEQECNNGFNGDIRNLETRMYIFWLSSLYIDMGCEAVMFSAVSATGSPTDNAAVWTDLVHRLQQYADQSDAVRFVLFSGHGGRGYADTAGNLLFDFAIEPLRPTERPRDTAYPVRSNGGACSIELNTDCPTLYGSGRGGLHPMGWYCDRNPGLVFFDNYMLTERNNPNARFDAWGSAHPVRRRNLWYCWDPYYLDEISWYALQTKAYRDSFLRYAFHRVHQLDTNIYLALPFKRSLAAGTDRFQEYSCDLGLHYATKEWWPAQYYAVDPDDSLFVRPKTMGNYFFAEPDRTRLPLNGGFGQEGVIRALWQEQAFK